MKLTELKSSPARWGAFLLISLFILYQMVRIIAFANVYGGVEHDSGWALGIARSVAERGTYTSLTSTVVKPHVQTDLNRDNQFTIQDGEGREYFFVGQTIGPGAILPNALVFKLFGVGFWQSRLAPLIFFCLFLILSSLILYSIQGLVSILVFHLYLFFFPQLYIFLGYEVFGEIPSMVYILISFILFVKATQATKRRSAWYFASGLFAGLAINTRLATIIIFGSMALVWLMLYWQKKATWRNAFMVIAGELFIATLWQLAIFMSLIQITELAAYINHVWGRFEFFYRSIKGITPVAEGLELFLLKALILSEISHSSLWISLLLALVTGLGGMVLIRHFWSAPGRRAMLMLLWLAWLIYTIWFLNGPKNAWVRYYWYGLVWMVMLLALMAGVMINQLRVKPTLANMAGSLFLALLFLFSFSSQPQAISFLIMPELIEIWQQRQLATKDTYLPWIIVPRAEQEQVAEFIRKLPPEAHIYYPEGHKTAELSFLTNRIFYTLPRRSFIGPQPNDTLVVGPAIISPWKKEQQQRQDILATTYRECPAIVLETTNYIICAVGVIGQN
jgi:hypothetical protein